MLQKSSDAVADAEGGMDQPGSSLVSGTLMKESGTVSGENDGKLLVCPKNEKGTPQAGVLSMAALGLNGHVMKGVAL